MNTSAFSATEDIQDIFGPLPLPEPTVWPIYLAAALGVILLFVLLFLYLKTKSKKQKKVPRIAPHTTALADLQAARSYLEEEQSLFYAERVSEILRHYVEQRFAIHSTRQTTTEFLQSIRREQGSTPSLLPYAESLQLCLEQCDLAKYAHKPANMKQMEEIEMSIRHFIVQTTAEEA